MDNWTALIRPVSRAINRCELTHLQRHPIELKTARDQHRAYCDALIELGCDVLEIEELPDHPDSVFVEDTAVVFDQLAILCRPGARSRRGEVQSVEDALAPYRQLARITSPATLDGGDVICAGSLVFVGRTSRTTGDSIGQMASLLEPHGFRVIEVEVSGCLHLKTAATAISDDAVLINPDWVEASDFGSLEVLHVDPSEPSSANVLRIGKGLMYDSGYPRTLARLRALGLEPVLIDASELAKAEGALTCCSLVFKNNP